MRGLAQAIVLLLLAGEASAYTFGGFLEGERAYLKRGPDDLVCEPAPASACRAIDKKAARDYKKPPRTRALDGAPLVVTAPDGKAIRLELGDRVIGEHVPGGRVSSVNANVFVSPDGSVVAVEYQLHGKGADVVAFSVAPQAAPSAPATLPPRAPDSGKTAWDRALGKGGVWEQRLVACDQAGVHLKLRKTRRFDLEIATKCQGQKSTTELEGTFVTEGSDTLVLQFENDEGPLERLECRLAACEGGSEDCLSCGDDEITFTMQVVRR